MNGSFRNDSITKSCEDQVALVRDPRVKPTEQRDARFFLEDAELLATIAIMRQPTCAIAITRNLDPRCLAEKEHDCLVGRDWRRDAGGNIGKFTKRTIEYTKRTAMIGEEFRRNCLRTDFAENSPQHRSDRSRPFMCRTNAFEFLNTLMDTLAKPRVLPCLLCVWRNRVHPSPNAGPRAIGGQRLLKLGT